MDTFEHNRRNFLRKLGLTFGATMAASSMISANILEKNDDLSLTPEQQAFMKRYNKWMDEFIEVIKIQKVTPHNMDNNKNIVRLSEQAKAWQSKLTEYMKDENFARHYMSATERMTLEI